VRCKKDAVKELNLSGSGSVREVAQNFGGIPAMRDEYFEL